GLALAEPNSGGSGPGGPGGQGSPAPSSAITLNMCNKANDIPVIFAAGVGLVGEQFRAQGWVQVPAGQCAQIGTFARPTFWWHARDPKGLVWGKDFDVD